MFSVIFLNVTSTEEQLQISLEELLQTEVSDNSDEKNEKCDQRPQLAVNSTKDKQVESFVQTFKCTKCKFSCSSKSLMRSHINEQVGKGAHLNIGYAKTPGIKKFECLTCAYACKQNGNMVKHVFTHTGEKPFVCPYCGSAFSRKDNMTSHVNQFHPK